MNSEIILCPTKFKAERLEKDCSICLKKQKDKLKIDSVKEHTLKKVELVTMYSRKWIEKAIYSNGKINSLNFIDSMSNAEDLIYNNLDIGYIKVKQEIKRIVIIAVEKTYIIAFFYKGLIFLFSHFVEIF